MSTPILDTKLPRVGTTIFATMSELAAQVKAVNLGQGFPDFDCDPTLIDHVNQAMRDGHNQYPPMPGVLALRQAISDKVHALYARRYDPASEITVTAGATQAIINAVIATVRPGDEVIVLEPCYDSYQPNIDMVGGTVVRVPLDPGTFRPNFEAIAKALNSKTRLMIINTPHNPGATVWTDSEMRQLEALLAPTNTLLVSDEVYEHMAYAPHVHRSASSYPGLAERAFVVSSFGKTYHVTGWKVAYCAAPAALTTEYRKVHQFNVFTVNSPMQHGFARHMSDPKPYLDLAAFYQRKRDRFRDGLARTHFQLLPCEGTYFQSVRIDGLKVNERHLSESEFCLWLTREIGVAAIPMSTFYADGFDQRVIRFCFAKKDETLESALERLAKL